MTNTTSIRVSKDIREKLKNYSRANNIPVVEAIDKITTFVLANGYTVADLKQLNSESSTDRIFKRIEDVISIVRGIERDNLKPLVKQVRYVDENVEQILSNMQVVQNLELEQGPSDVTPHSSDADAYENFSRARDGKWFIEKAEKGSKLYGRVKSLLEELDKRIEVTQTEKRYILNDKIEKQINEIKDLLENF
ncbi:MAG: BfmA/BtgA family mobilization protein [Lacrimispora sphenoides]